MVQKGFNFLPKFLLFHVVILFSMPSSRLSINLTTLLFEDLQRKNKTMALPGDDYGTPEYSTSRDPCGHHEKMPRFIAAKIGWDTSPHNRNGT
jgi:hypothetical protein